VLFVLARKLNQEPSENPVPAEVVDPQAPPRQTSFSEDSLGGSPPNRLSLSGWISWIVIAAFTVFILGNTTLQQFGEHEVSTEASVGDLMQVNLQAKMIIGQKELVEGVLASVPAEVTEEIPGGEDVDEDVDEGEVGDELTEALGGIELPPAADMSMLDAGAYEQRLCYAAILNEVNGPEASLEYLDELDTKVADNDFQRSEKQVEMESSVRQLMESYRDGNLVSQDILADQQQQQL